MTYHGRGIDPGIRTARVTREFLPVRFAQSYMNLTPLFGEFQGIRHQVREHLLHPDTVPSDVTRHTITDGGSQLDPLELGRAMERRHDRIQHPGHVHHLVPQSEPPLLNALGLEDVVENQLQTLAPLLLG